MTAFLQDYVEIFDFLRGEGCSGGGGLIGEVLDEGLDELAGYGAELVEIADYCYEVFLFLPEFAVTQFLNLLIILLLIL